MPAKKKITVVKPEVEEPEVPEIGFDIKEFMRLKEENARLKAEKAGEPVLEAQAEVPEPTPEIDEHPDIVFGDTTFRWIGKLTHKRINKVYEKQRVNGEMRDVEIGTEDEITNYPGVCMSCGVPLYVLHEGKNVGAIGDQLAVCVVGAQGERPATYCQVHDPTRRMRRAGLKEGEIMPGDLFQIQQAPIVT